MNWLHCFKERIVHIVIRCEDVSCEMDKIRRELDQVSAKIVIANVENDNAEYLVKNDDRKITWILRDMPAKDKNYYVYYLHKNLDVFSISLRTVKKTQDCNVEDNILTGLSSIALAHKQMSKEDYAVIKRSEFYRRFAVIVKKITTRKTEAIAFVNKLTSYGNEEIATMYVDDSGAELLTFKDPFKFGKPSDGTTHCLVSGYDYFKPCNDLQVMLLMFIIMLFVITFLMITCYFDKASPLNDIRYRRF